MNTANDSFSQSCYFAPAGQSFTLDFTNPVFTEANDQATTFVLTIAPNASPVAVAVPNEPGFVQGSTVNASFVSAPVTAPNTGQFTVNPF